MQHIYPSIYIGRCSSRSMWSQRSCRSSISKLLLSKPFCPSSASFSAPAWAQIHGVSLTVDLSPSSLINQLVQIRWPRGWSGLPNDRVDRLARNGCPEHSVAADDLTTTWPWRGEGSSITSLFGLLWLYRSPPWGSGLDWTTSLPRPLR